MAREKLAGWKMCMSLINLPLLSGYVNKMEQEGEQKA